MGTLAIYLQQAFSELSSSDWKCYSEIPLLSRQMESRLGYSSRVDVLLEHLKSNKRLWIEFEISRADPVANHAKFATSHLFSPQQDQDIFISMISSHVQRGRRNLASNTIYLLRQIGMNAFQIPLFPTLPPDEIKRLNHLPLENLINENLDVAAELSRAVSISEAIIVTPEHRIHFAGDLMEVFLNLYQWNEDIKESEARKNWGKRKITYFVFDPCSKLFAPSKFCAYTAILPALKINDQKVLQPEFSVMTIQQYVCLDESDRRFDGRKARLHLVNSLGMKALKANEFEAVQKYFQKWLKDNIDLIHLHPRGPIFLTPPPWFR